MSVTDDGGPITSAMELRQLNDIQELSPVGGLSIRDWFAGMALQGEVANPSAKLFEADSITFDDLAGDCYRIADAMIAARKESA